MPHFERLNPLDRAFLTNESSTQHMHVAGVATFHAGPLRTPDGGIDIDRIRKYVESRMHLIPRYRQILSRPPLFAGAAVWVDDPHFNLHYHVRHTALPRPGDERQLKRLSGRIMSQQLDRTKPLWEMWIVEGLEGDRFALISKIHHCMVDGVSSVDLMTVLLTPQPQDEFPEALPYRPRPAPGPAELVLAEVETALEAPGKVAELLRGYVQRGEGNLRAALRSTGEVLGTSLQRASATPLNQPIGSHRRFDWLAMDLSHVKQVRHALGGSVNDVVLATTTGAVRRFLLQRGVAVDGLRFRVMAPVSTRSEDQRGTLGNQVSAWLVDLPIDEPDPARRIHKIRETTERLKQTNQALGAEVLTTVMTWTPATLLSVATRLLLRALPFNLVVTNVPGPQVPLYMLGARMLDNYGLVPLTDYLGLGIVLFSYAGKLCWGFNADWDLLPDLHDFVEHTAGAFEELRAARPG